MNKKLLILISVLLIIFLGLLAAALVLFNENPKDLEEIVDVEGNVIDTSSGQFATVKEAIQNLNIFYIKTTKPEKPNMVMDVYVEFTKELNLKNQSYFETCINTVAYEIKYNSFRIIDEKNNIEIEVICDSKEKNIKKILINQDDNYFNKLKINKQIEEYTPTKETSVNINSSLLKYIIENNWDMASSGYEGLGKGYLPIVANVSAKVIDNKFYTIYFEKNYKAPIVNNLVVGDSFAKIEQVLRESTLNTHSSVIGYKTKDFYVFFSGIGIGVYRRETKIDNTLQEAIKIIEKENNVGKAIELIKKNWPDYDVCEQTEKGTKLKYTLKGVEIQTYDTSKPQIAIYSNYEGKVKDNKTIKELLNVSLPSEVTLNLDKNLIYEDAYEKYDESTRS